MTHETLDARGLLCPMPVIRTQNRALALQPGDTLEVLCTDPGVVNDIPAWCRINGHTVQDIRREQHDIIITIGIGG